MSSQQISRVAIVIRKIISFLAIVLGGLIDFVFGITFLSGKYKDKGSLIVLLVFIAIGTALIVYGIINNRKIKRFKNYVNIMSLDNQTSLNDIANSSSQSIDFVSKDLQDMINQKFFTTAYIDKQTNEFVLQKKYTSVRTDTINYNKVNDDTEKKEQPLEYKAVTCKSCGASNNIIVGTAAECEFCGSALK